MSRLIPFVLLLIACARQVNERPAVLWFGGDVHLGTRGEQSLASLTLDAPLIVNLEGPISASLAPSTAQRLTNPRSTPRVLAAAGVVAVGVDNNHALDEGEAGREATKRALRDEGLLPLGSARVRGVSMLQVDLSFGVPSDLEMRLATTQPTVVLFHVLAQPLYLPEPELKRAVDLAVKSGAKAVLAHGSHALGPVERRGETVIAWGLGNLVFDCDCTDEDDGLLVRLVFDSGHVHASVVPVLAGLHGNPALLPVDGSLTLELLENLGSRLHGHTKQRAEW